MENERGNVVLDRSFSFAIRVVKLHKHQHLVERHKVFALADQLLRSGTSIGANVTEAQDAQSKKDFVSKLSIALKEAKESRYWIRLLVATDYLDAKQPHVISLQNDIAVLTTIIKSSKQA
ncbi:four helix bundle protein [Hydrogenimonas sp.]